MMENHKRRTRVAASRAFPAVTSTFSVHSNAAQKNGRMIHAAQSTKCRIYQQMRAMRSKMESWDGQGSGCETSMLASVKQMRDNEDCGERRCGVIKVGGSCNADA
jgi:hypothetical protein